MKVTMEFNLSKEEDKFKYELINDVEKLVSLIVKWDRELNKMLESYDNKFDGDSSEKELYQEDLVRGIHEKWYTLKDELGINDDLLY